MERGNQPTGTEDSGELALLEQDDEANQASEEFGDLAMAGEQEQDSDHGNLGPGGGQDLAMAGEQEEDSDHGNLDLGGEQV